MRLLNVFAAVAVLSISLTSCLKEDALTTSPVGAPNFNQLPASLGGGGGINQQYTWSPIADFPGAGRDAAIAFTLNGLGYAGLGHAYPNFFSDLYSYNPNANVWTRLDTFPGGARRSATSFVLNDTVYVGLGYGRNYSAGRWEEFRDLWKYNAAADRWIQLNDVPFYSTESAQTFVIGSKAYAVLENGDVYDYEAETDTWTQRKELNESGINSRGSAVSFAIGSRGYYGTGNDDGLSSLDSRLRDLYEYNPSSDTWTTLDSLPDAKRNNAVSFVINGFGVIGMGNDFFSNYADFHYYRPDIKQWSRLNDYPGGPGSDLCAFVINNQAYVGLGYLDAGGFLGGQSNKFYRISL